VEAVDAIMVSAVVVVAVEATGVLRFLSPAYRLPKLLRLAQEAQARHLQVTTEALEVPLLSVHTSPYLVGVVVETMAMVAQVAQ
jgi:hypothetical protein